MTFKTVFKHQLRPSCKLHEQGSLLGKHLLAIIIIIIIIIIVVVVVVVVVVIIIMDPVQNTEFFSMISILNGPHISIEKIKGRNSPDIYLSNSFLISNFLKALCNALKVL